MHFDLGGHIRSRSRSSQLEKTLASVAAMGSMTLTDGKRSMRTVSAPRSTGPLVENTNISNVGNRLRSSLQGNLGGSLRENSAEKPCGIDTLVYCDENPPKLLPVQPMTYDELYADTTTEIETTEKTENSKDGVEDEIEDDVDETMEPVFLICKPTCCSLVSYGLPLPSNFNTTITYTHPKRFSPFCAAWRIQYL